MVSDDNDLSLNQQINSESLSFIDPQDQEEKYITNPKVNYEGNNDEDDTVLNKSQETRSKGKLRKTLGHYRLSKGKGMRHMVHGSPKLNDHLSNERGKSHKKVVDHISAESDKKEMTSIDKHNSGPIMEMKTVDGTNNSKSMDANIEQNKFEHSLEDQKDDNTQTDDELDNEPDDSDLLEETSPGKSKNESELTHKNSDLPVEHKIKSRLSKLKILKSSSTDDKNKETKGSDKGFIDDLRKTHLNTLIERKLKDQLKNKSNVKDKRLDNFKFTNKSFIDDFQKKLKSLTDNSILSSKFQPNDKIFTKTNENSDWIFDQGKVVSSELKDKAAVENKQFDYVHEQKKLDQTDSVHTNEHKHTKEINYKGYNTSKNNNSTSYPKLVNSYKKRHEVKEKEDDGKDNMINKDASELNVKLNEAEHPHDSKRRTKKKVHSKNLFPKKNDITSLENETERKRDQRDIKGSRSKVDTRNKSSFVNHVADEKVNALSDEDEDIDAEGPEPIEDSDSEPHYHGQLHTNDDEDYSYKSHSQDTGDVDKSDESEGMFARRPQDSRYNNEISPTETCVGYKAGAVATTSCPQQQTTCSQATTKSMLSTQKRGNNHIKIKNTTCRPENSTKKVQTTPKAKNNNNQSVPIEALDIYDKFLCGQLIDDFIEAVLVKVRRSPQIQKELGFQNDTEESCDRCIETKPNKMPDLETMKSSLGKCTKSPSKSNCFKCYNVPKPMDKFLSMLVSYEKDHETSVYNKIKDESSFIFSGDYPDQLIGSDDGIVNRKYNEEAIGKDDVDKERLREDLNEEKNDDQLSSGALNKKPNNKQSEHSTDNEEDNEADRPLSKSNHDNKKTNDKDGAHEKPQIRTVTSLKDSDLEEEYDPPIPGRNKFITYKDPDLGAPDDSQDSYSANQIRHFNKHDNKQKGSFYQPEEFKYETNRQSRPYDKMSDSGLFDTVPSKGSHSDQNIFRGGFQNSYGSSKSFPGKLNKYTNDFDFKEYHPYKNEYAVELSDHNNRMKHADTHFNYPSGYDKNYRIYPELNKQTGKSMSNMDLGVLENNYDEYPLVSNQLMRHSNKNVGGMRTQEQYDSSYQDDRMKMVKRDIEPNDEEETVVFEIPDVEYDLY